MDTEYKRFVEKPVIAVTGSDTRFPIAWWCTAFIIWTCGGKATRFTPSSYIYKKKTLLQGVVIGGGNDIDPTLYGEKTDRKRRLDIARDTFEIEMIRFALRHNIPLLGICRGAQLINVVLGGTLFINIRASRKHTSNIRTPLPRKTAVLEQGTRLFKNFKEMKIKINSLHYQAINKLGQDLRIIAKDLDDFVQAFESTKHRFVIGTQWHPEYLFYLSNQRALFRQLINKASYTSPKSLNV